jgi:uncharacterized protein YeaO (DUF488 family)
MNFWEKLVYPFTTLIFIYKHGWAEYREQRRRYDEHMRLTGYGEAKYNHREAIKQANLLRKARNR